MGRTRRALADINLQLIKASLFFISGPSGAGKSTLLKLLFREEEPSEGQILIDGAMSRSLPSRGVAQFRRKIGLVFQDFQALPHLTALDNVALAAQVIGSFEKREPNQSAPFVERARLKGKLRCQTVHALGRRATTGRHRACADQ